MNWLKSTRSATLDTAAIDLNDETYRIPSFQNLEPLVESVKELGIVNSPVVQESSGGGYRPVLGRRRLRAAAGLGMDQIEVGIVPSAMSDREGFAISFWDNAAHRLFDRASIAYLVRRLLELFPVAEVARDFLPRLGVPAKGPALKRLQAIGGLEEPILRAFSDGLLLEKTAALMTELDSDNRTVVLSLIEGLGMNANKNADLVSNLFDLAIANRCTLADYVHAPESQGILDRNGLSRPQRAELFREHVRSLRNPEFSSHGKEVREWIASLSSSPMIAIRPAPAFESDEFKVEIRGQSREDVERVLKNLGAIDP